MVLLPVPCLVQYAAGPRHVSRTSPPGSMGEMEMAGEVMDPLPDVLTMRALLRSLPSASLPPPTQPIPLPAPGSMWGPRLIRLETFTHLSNSKTSQSLLQWVGILQGP